MRNKTFAFLSLVLLIFVGTACSEVSSDETLHGNPQKSDYQLLNENIKALNLEPAGPHTRFWKGWKYIGGFGADSFMFFLTHNIKHSISASIHVYRFIKTLEEITSDEAESTLNDRDTAMSAFADKDDKFIDIDNDAYIHNTVILDLYDEYGEDLFEMDLDELYDAVTARVNEINGYNADDVIEDTSSLEEIDDATEAYIDAETPAEYIAELSAIYPDKAEQLSVLQSIFEGFLNADTDEAKTEYTSKIVDIIENSNISDEDKEDLKKSVCIANASARLWKTRNSNN